MRTVGWAALLIGLVCSVSAAPPEKSGGKSEDLKEQTLKGKVISLAEIVKKHGVELDPEAAPHWLALVADDGKVYPIVKDNGGRTFYRDSNLLKRPMQIQGRVLPGSQLLQVLQVQSLKDGKVHEVYYWCDVCAIKRYWLPEKCECCGGPMHLREEPISK